MKCRERVFQHERGDVIPDWIVAEALVMSLIGWWTRMFRSSTGRRARAVSHAVEGGPSSVASPSAADSVQTSSRFARRRTRFDTRARSSKFLSVLGGMAVVGGTAFGVTNWGVQLAGGSAGEAESAAVTNVTISAQSTPSAANLL